jgi:cytochrome c oxidase subunit II
MSMEIPAKDWFKPPTGFERVWIGLALIWCLVMFLAMPYWHFKGKQNSTGEAYTVAPADFMARVDRFVEAHKVGEQDGMAVVEPPPGSDIYLLSQMWRFYPILKLKKGQTYRLHVSSPDLQHGLSIQPMNINFHVLPGYDHVITMTPTSSGVFPLICNEFCGIGHHQMTGRIIVED